ncbi:uncharacterized protein [Spinacia oleracea]|uniref:Uncharacterized protein n=1 Tax=Spinacia oleracea TaxID=3562 RepID=A0A9R0JTV0_SPIOL|nr:uncharacterized protein LOC110786174 [Spinacia oleracea]
MVRNFICGSNNFPREEDAYERQTRSADSSPSRSRSKNPYSSRGLDKFSTLLLKIEEKRQQIYSQVDPDEISLVRFAYSGDHGFKSIVVKAKPKSSPHYTPQPKQPKPQPQPQLYQNIHKPLSIRKLQSSKSMNVNQEVKAENEVHKKLRVHQWKDPKLILVIIILLILLFLLLFGRSFAIMCTSIGWYFIPTIITKTNSNPCSNLRLSFKKKDYAIPRPSHKKLIMTSEGTNSFKTSDGLT